MCSLMVEVAVLLRVSGSALLLRFPIAEILKMFHDIANWALGLLDHVLYVQLTYTYVYVNFL